MTGLTCPTCGDDRLDVKDSRPHLTGVCRTRQCVGCGQRMRTRETVVAVAPTNERISGRQFIPIDDLTTDVDAIVSDISAMLPALIRRSLRRQRDRADA